VTGIKERFAKIEEWRYQCILLAFLRPIEVGPEVRKQGRDDLRAIIGCLEKTHGARHSTILGMSALLVQFVALFSIQEAYAQLAEL
jgi:hypothetical protein